MIPKSGNRFSEKNHAPEKVSPQGGGGGSRGGRRQRFEPRLRRAFPGFALGRLEALHEAVEPGVASTARLGHKMPFGGGRWVRRKALAGREDAGETVLRDRAALPRRLAQDRRRTGFIARHTGAVVERDRVFDLAVDVTGAGGGGEAAP